MVRRIILAQDLVPGDWFSLKKDRISADSRLVAVTDLQVNQSASLVSLILFISQISGFDSPTRLS